MDTLIYILLGIIWLGYQYYQKNRKENAARTSSQEGAFDTDSFQQEAAGTEDDFGRMFQQFFDVPVAKQEPVFAEEVKETTSAYDEGEAPEIEVPYESVEYQSESKYQQEMKKDWNPESTEEETSAIAQDFDLEKAVIYSEILKPKYF